MADIALVSEDECGELIELPTEEDGGLLLSTVAAQFAGVSGLKHRAPQGGLRGLRLAHGRLWPPAGGWRAARYWCTFPRPASPAPPAAPRPRCSDLIVLGLPWRTDEDSVRHYFSALGDLVMVQVKRDARTGLSKGFGFIKFASYEAQLRALERRHLVDGRWCDVRLPHSREPAPQRKVFVGRCTEALTAADLRDYFAAFGQVTDVFVPRPFRAFSFVTFLDPEVAQSLCGQDHIIKGVSVNISTASPKRAGSAGAGGGLLGWAPLDGPRLVGWPCERWAPLTRPSAPPDSKHYLSYE